MAIEKNLKTRIILTHDDYANFSGIILKNGEVVLAKVGETEAAGKVSEPIWMMKVGDGVKTFENCSWVVAPAADVYEWAKKENLDPEDLPEIPGDKLGIKVTVTGDGNAITDASWDAATKTLTLTKGETFITKDEFDNREDKDTTYDAGRKLELDDTTFNHKLTERKDTLSDNAVNAEFGGTIEIIDSVTSDETGHITAVNKKKITLPTPEEVSLPTVADAEVAGQVVVEVDQNEGAIAVTRKAIDVSYDSGNRKIQLKINDELIGTGFDASEFVKDGMIKSVVLVETDDKENTGKFLKIVWNTPALDDEDVITYIDLTTLIDVYTAGNGIDIQGKVINHADTSSVANVTKTDRTYISGIEFDEFGHVTKVETGVEVDQDLTHNHDDQYKKLQTVVEKDGAAGKTITKVTQNENGEVDVTYEDIAITSSQVIDLDVGVTKVSTTANNGLKVTPEAGTGDVVIDIDDTIIFILDGGTAEDLLKQ